MIWSFTYICFNFLFWVCEGFIFWNNNNTKIEHAVVPNATHPTELPGHEDFDPVKAEAGAIAGVVFGVLVSVGFIVFAGIMYLRKKRERDLEYHRKTKVLKQSSQSAGVYVDTTQEFISGRTRNTEDRGPEYKHLQKDSNISESDSEDEL